MNVKITVLLISVCVFFLPQLTSYHSSQQNLTFNRSCILKTKYNIDIIFQQITIYGGKQLQTSHKKLPKCDVKNKKKLA